MIDVHIDDFYHDIAVTLLTLYQQFPRKVSIYIEDISGPDTTDEFGLHSARHLACLGAILWLHDEDYIRYETRVKEESIEAATLTERAFLKLTQPQRTLMDAIDPINATSLSVRKQQSTLIYQLYNAVKEKNSIQIRELIQHYFLPYN